MTGWRRGSSIALLCFISTAPTAGAQAGTSTTDTVGTKQTRASPASNTYDLLREIPSVELPRISSIVAPTEQFVSIRGVDEGRVLVFLDGIPVNDAWGEWVDWGRVPLHSLDHVAILEGGGSSIYGSGALGGVINFFSRQLAPASTSLQIDGGARGARHAYVGAGIPLLGAFSAQVTGDYGEGGGYRLADTIGPGCPQPSTATARCQLGSIDTPSTSIRRNLSARVNYSPSSTLSAFVAGHKYGDDIAIGTPLGTQRRDWGGVSTGLDWGAIKLRGWTTAQTEHQRATVVRATAGAVLTPFEPQCPLQIARVCEDSSIVATIPSHDWGGSATWSRAGLFHLQSFTLGADYRQMQGAFDERDYSTACPNTSPLNLSCGKFLRSIWSGGTQAFAGAFVQAMAIPMAALTVEVSARADRWNNTHGAEVDSAAAAATPNATAFASHGGGVFSPRLGLRYQLPLGLALRAAAYTGFRDPNLAQLYREQINASGSQITIPNPDLEPEKAVGREVGFDYRPWVWAELSGTFYVADYTAFNVVAATPLSSFCGRTFLGTCRQRINLNASRSTGADATIAVRPLSGLQVTLSVAYDDARQQSNLVDSDLPKPYVTRIPSPKQVAKVAYTDQRFGTWTGIWRHEGRTTTLTGPWLDAYSVVDANVQREIGLGVTGFASIENIGDHRYMVNVAGAGTSTVVSYGTPRTLRIGMMVDR